MGRWVVAAFAIGLGAGFAPPALATNLNLRLESAGTSVVTVGPGATVGWSAIGELSDGANEGLALFAFDLEWTGGPLSPAAAPTASPLLNFARPLGISNPAGFGGTPSAGRLLQVGGGQNTINNTFAPYPTGSLITGVASPGQPAVLATGQLTAPVVPGKYSLTASTLLANVVRQGDTGDPFWRVDKAGPGTLTPLVVRVVGPVPGDRVRR